MKYGRYIYMIDDRNMLTNVGKGGTGTQLVQWTLRQVTQTDQLIAEDSRDKS